MPPIRRDFTVRYLVESFEPLDRAAEVIAGEQSCGTFVTLPGETAELKERARARVLSIEKLEDAASPSLPNAFADRKGVRGPYQRGVVSVSFPIHNVGANLPNLYATIAGNLFELGELTACGCSTWTCRRTTRRSSRDRLSARSGRATSPRCSAGR